MRWCMPRSSAMAQPENAEHMQRVEAEYLAALCAIYLYHKDAVWRMDRFVDRHPNPHGFPNCVGNSATTSIGGRSGPRPWTPLTPESPPPRQGRAEQSFTSNAAMPVSKSRRPRRGPGDLLEGDRQRRMLPRNSWKPPAITSHTSPVRRATTSALDEFEELLRGCVPQCRPGLHRPDPA